MIERHYFGNELIKSFDFNFGFCIPGSTNTWEAVYALPPLDSAMGECVGRFGAVRWCCGSVAVWRCGVVAVWRRGGVAAWRRDGVTVWSYGGSSMSACVLFTPVVQYECVGVCTGHGARALPVTRGAIVLHVRRVREVLTVRGM